MKLLFHYPSRKRPELFMATIANYYDMMSTRNYEFHISIDKDDVEMNCNYIKEFCSYFNWLTLHVGSSNTKIEACNADIPATDWDILILISDDMTPQRYGFDQLIIDHMQTRYPNLDGALWFNDGRVGNRVCTLSIMGRKLYDHFGYIYHPAYRSVFCDNEFTEICQSMNKITYIDDVIIKHDWVGDYDTPDELHKLNDQHYMRDKDIFDDRKAKGFPR